jgi:signal transduction histidine kinase
VTLHDLDGFDVLAGAAYAALAVAWWAAAVSTWRYGESLIGRTLTRLSAVLATCTALFWVACALQALTPFGPGVLPPSWVRPIYLLHSWMFVAIGAGAHQHARASVGKPITSTWLLANYLPAVVLAALAALFVFVAPGPGAANFHAFQGVLFSAVVCWFGLAAAQLRPRGRAGGWRPGVASLGPRRRDVKMMTLGAAVIGIAVPLVVLRVGPSGSEFLLQFGAGLLLSLPGLARVGAEAIRRVAIAGGVLLLVAATFLLMRTAVAPLVALGLPVLADVLQVTTLALVVVPGHRAIAAFVDGVLLHRRRAWEQAEAVLRTLPADEGVHACVECALERLVRAPEIDGAAIVLGDGFARGAGSLDVEAIRRVWPTPASDPERHARLSATPLFAMPEPIASTLAEQDITAIIEIPGARHVWGHLFVVMRAIVGTMSPTDVEPVRNLAAQFGLLLDAAAVVERAVAMERSLAQAEKLAAVGETAARIAHEIRNPVTAARSLAQLLARHPESPRNAERAAIVLEELERVEQRVASLLRFSKDEVLRTAPLALDELARETLAALEGRLGEAGITVVVDAPSTVVAMGDAEKLRQVLVNLIENAVDAMSAQEAPRRLVVTVSRRNDTACLQVADNGPGIDDALRTRAFEPFVSGKPNGTGLGLAIAKHVIDAHGGTLALDARKTGGTVATLTIPAGETKT